MFQVSVELFLNVLYNFGILVGIWLSSFSLLGTVMSIGVILLLSFSVILRRWERRDGVSSYIRIKRIRIWLTAIGSLLAITLLLGVPFKEWQEFQLLIHYGFPLLGLAFRVILPYGLVFLFVGVVSFFLIRKKILTKERKGLSGSPGNGMVSS